ncbi:MAG: hypothetical protein IPK16_17935 [Anaerolineales bacterium]|nr:hypothetical protein [Anaerolineales bacterium]
MQEELLTYHSASEMLAALRTGKLDIGMMGKLTAETAARNRAFKIVGEGLSAQEFAIAAPKGAAWLHNSIRRCSPWSPMANSLPSPNNICRNHRWRTPPRPAPS